MPCREGLPLATDLLTRRVHIETKCAAAVKSFQGPDMGRYDQVTRELKAGRASFNRA
jgi:hypothetical protein